MEKIVLRPAQHNPKGIRPSSVEGQSRRIGIITEETADLPQEIIGKHQIAIVPAKLVRGKEILKREIGWLIEEKYGGKLTEEAKKDIEKLKKGEPVDYLIGFVEFLGSKIDLSQRPFIPRPETEFWLEKAIKEIQNSKFRVPAKRVQNLKILDLFSGSGCIGLAILKNVKKAKVDFAEIQKKFLKQIEINLKLNRVNKKRYRIIRSDIFDETTGKYDYIFANPPYISNKRLREVQKSVLNFEPKNSFFGGKDGLLYIKKFLKEAKSHLKKTGRIYLEFDPFQKEEIIKILNEFNYSSYQIHRDQYGKWRYLIVGL